MRWREWGCEDEDVTSDYDGDVASQGASHALGLAELAIQGVDIVLTQSLVGQPDVPAGVPLFQLDDGDGEGDFEDDFGPISTAACVAAEWAPLDHSCSSPRGCR